MLDGGSGIGKIGADLSINLMEDFKMNLFRSATIAVALMIPFGLAQATTSNTPPPPPALTSSHPSFSVTEDRTLDLREAGSQIVIQTIEDALRQGGLALLGEGFQLDSSLVYHSGDNEGIEGDLDVVVPLWNGGRHAIFTQPGFVFWKGIEGEERFDGNIGLVYRAELTRNLIAGASVFYDHDFEIGHSRVSGGIDLQSGFFRFGANYYHPLSEVEDGREGFVEEALTGMDARLVFEREAVRLGSTIGYWDYKGEESGGQEDSRSGWQTSIGLDFGVRILPGVFAEASWERHKDNIVLDERIFAGLAFRFSLPGFEGASYGSGEMTSNLYKIVDREKRILYEERVGVPSVSIVRTGNETIAEGSTIAVDVQLSEVLTEDVTINLIGDGTATYGTDGDWVLNNGSGNCDSVEGTDCQVVITAGQLSPSGDVVITINEDGRTNEPIESIILSMVIDSPANTDLLPRGPFTLTIPEDPPLPAVSISATSTSIAEGGSATLTATLTETVTEDVVINLLEGGAADYGTGMDWHLNNGSDCNTATGTSCQITITAGQRSATATVNVNTDSNVESTPETFTVEIDITSPDSTVVIEGSPSSLSFTIEDVPPPTVSLNYIQDRGNNPDQNRRIRIGQVSEMRIELSEALNEDVTLNIVAQTTLDYGSQYQVFVDTTQCDTIASNTCQATISANSTSSQIDLASVGGKDNVTISITIASAGSTGLVLGSTVEQTITLE